MSNTETCTQTITATEVKVVKYPVFLAFAEYFGYVSPFMAWAMKLNEGKDIPDFMKRILYTEAITILHEMLKEIDAPKMRELYDKYYELILNEYDEKAKDNAYIDNLPF